LIEKDYASYNDKDIKDMSIAKSNRCNEYIKEIEDIKYQYLDKNEYAITPLQRKFYEHRVELLENYILNYLNTTDAKENS